MLINRLELPSNFLPDIKVEVLGHYSHFLCPSDGQLVIREILYGFAQKVCTVYSSYKWLSLIT